MKEYKLSSKEVKYISEDNYNAKIKATSYKKKIYTAPTTINLEMTEACNVKRRHCYNPWGDETCWKI